MKKIIILLIFILTTFNGYAQDFRIDTAVTFSGGIVSQPPNYIRQNCHIVIKTNDSTWVYEPQFFTEDSLGHQLLPNDDLTGWRSRGTVIRFDVDSIQAELTPDSLRTLFILPDLKAIYGTNNVTKL